MYDRTLTFESSYAPSVAVDPEVSIMSTTSLSENLHMAGLAATRSAEHCPASLLSILC